MNYLFVPLAETPVADDIDAAASNPHLQLVGLAGFVALALTRDIPKPYQLPVAVANGIFAGTSALRWLNDKIPLGRGAWAVAVGVAAAYGASRAMKNREREIYP